MPESVRVLMVVRLFYPWVGGAERQAHRLARKLREKGARVEIVTGWWFRGTPQAETLDGIPVFRNHTLWEMFSLRGLRKFGGYLYILTLLAYLWRRRADFDVVHVHGLSYHAFPVALARRWFHLKTVVKPANSGVASDLLKMRGGQQLALSRFLLPAALQADRFVAINNAVAQELAAAGVPRGRICRLANGLDAAEFKPKASYALHSPARLVYVGRLHPQKGLDVLLQALDRLRLQAPDLDFRLQMVGDGPLADELRRTAVRSGLDGRVEFTGQTDRVQEYLQAADIFVLPSRAEGISNALLEAMACGLPVVVSDVPGNLAVIDHDQNGLVFQMDHPEALAGCLQRLLAQPEYRRRLGQAARRTVELDYSLDVVAARTLALYRDLLAGGPEPVGLPDERPAPSVDPRVDLEA